MNWTPDQVAEIERRMAVWRKAPDGPIIFAKDVLNVELTGHQKRLLRAIAEFTPGEGKYGVSAVSGQGCGKSVAAAIVIIWFLVVFHNSLVNVTAPTERQLKTVLWAELEKLINNSPFLKSVLDWQATRVGVFGENVQWQAVARTATNVESIHGQHRKHMLIVVDEASGVDDKIMEALLGGMTEPHNLALMISNPMRTHGIFYDSHHSKRHLWTTMRFSARESPLVSLDHIKRMADYYGEDSPIFRIRVEGEFPMQSDKALFSLAWVEEASNRPLFKEEDEAIEMGVDVGRFGADLSAVAVRQGRNLLHVSAWHGADIIETAARIIDLIRNKFPDTSCIKIDESGIGAGLCDYMEMMARQVDILGKVSIEPIQVGERSDDNTKWALLRDQLWCEFADRLRNGDFAISSSIPRDVIDMLAAELTPVEYEFKPNGARKVESKEEMRKKMDRSPDIADAVILAYRQYYSGIVGWL